MGSTFIQGSNFQSTLQSFGKQRNSVGIPSDYVSGFKTISANQSPSKEIILTNSVRPHLNILSKVKIVQEEELRAKRRFESYNRDASVFKANYGEEKMTINPNDIPKTKNTKTPVIADKFPKLMKELNDSHCPIPAYSRFQSPAACALRSDLKQMKRDHFKMIYNKELSKPKMLMQNVIKSRLENVDSSTYFEMKYFLTQQQRDQVNEDPDPNKKDIKKMKSMLMVKVRDDRYDDKLDCYEEALTIPNDIDRDQDLIQKFFDDFYTSQSHFFDYIKNNDSEAQDK